MAGITLAQAEAKLAIWLAAEEGLAGSQSYTITVEGNTRALTRANLAEVGKRIAYWNTMVTKLTNRTGGISRSRTVVN